MSKQINIYACGGAGVNIATHFTRFIGRSEEGFAEVKPYFVDTSKSNMGSIVPQEYVYLFDGLDGNGKQRNQNYDVISDPALVNDILYQFKPADLNIILHSASGGSGSVIGPVLAAELLKRDALTVVIMVGATSCEKEVENTLNTLKSYERISHLTGKPVVAAYRENTVAQPRGQVDHELQTTILILAALFSGNNRELDMADLRNFLNYNRVTSYMPRLSLLEFSSQNILLTKGQSVASLATLVDDQTSSEPNVLVEYQAVGFLPEGAKANIKHPLPLHSCVIHGYFHGVVESLEAKLSEYAEEKKTRSSKSIVKESDTSTELGLVL